MKRLLSIILFICIVSYTFAGRVDTLVVECKAMNKMINNLVIIPVGYDLAYKEHFPVLYLLHGAGGDYANWFTRVPEIERLADKHNMIIVCPDGGTTSWYFDSPVDSTMNYETFISKDLVQSVDKAYRTRAYVEGRAITGLSMGGHGAFYLAFKHQDVWGAAGSMSGGLDIRPFPQNWALAKRLGSQSEHPANWEENSVINMVHLLKESQLSLIFDCGVDDFFYDVNKNMHQTLLENNIPHEFIVRPGGHSWEYWSNAISYHILFFSNWFSDKEMEKRKVKKQIQNHEE